MSKSNQDGSNNPKPQAGGGSGRCVRSGQGGSFGRDSTGRKQRQRDRRGLRRRDGSGRTDGKARGRMRSATE